MKRDNILDPKFESLVSTINDHSVKENECFILYMIYLNIKCLLKNSRFYPDTTLRLRLFCKQHNSKKHLIVNKNHECVYMDRMRQQWKTFLKMRRQGKYWQKCTVKLILKKPNDTIFKVKSEYKDMVAHIFDHCRGLKEGWETIGNKRDIKLSV